MLDVHVPHGSARSWKDFLFHIGTIACGLILALLLEKTAEYIHELHLLSEARRELAAELEDNRRGWQKNSVEVQRIRRELEVDLKVIRSLRNHALPEGKLDYSVNLYATFDGAWQAVHQNGALSLMPQKELTDEAWFYRMLADLLEAVSRISLAIKINAAMAASAPPEQLGNRQLDELEIRTLEAQGSLDYVQMFLDIEEGGIDLLSGVSRGKVASK